MKRTIACLALASAVVALATAVAVAFPKPSPYPKSWQLKFKHEKVKRIEVKIAGQDKPQAYWYLPFTLTNETKEEQRFLPLIDMLAADGSIVRADRNIPPSVFEAIKAREKNKFLEPLSKVTGRILPGEDQARESVAIWPEVDRKMGKFSIFVKGLSGEASLYRIKDGEYEEVEKVDVDEKGQPKENLLLLRKTLQMDFEATGEAEKAEMLKETWIMR